MFSKKSKLAAAIAALAFSGSVVADEFQFEGVVSLSDGDIEVGSDEGDTDSIGIAGTAYFAPVDDSKGPLAEAAFLDRASSVSAAFSDGEAGDLDVEGRGIDLRLVDGESGWTLGLDFATVEVEDADSDTFGVSVGNYVAENTEVSLSFASTDVDGGDDSDSWFLGVHHVVPADVSYAIGAAIGTVEVGDDDETAFSIDGTVYPNNNLGLGVSYATVDGDVDNDTVSIFGEWFVNNQFAVMLSFDDSEIGDVETDGFTIGVRGRF